MTPLHFITVLALYVAIYIFFAYSASSKYFQQFPGEEKRIPRNSFYEIQKSILVVGLIFSPEKTSRLVSSSAKLQFKVARFLLVGLPVFFFALLVVYVVW